MPLVYGFRGYPPRAQVFAHPFTGAVIATPVLDLSMMPTGVGVAKDRSIYGNDGIIVGAVGTKGVYNTALKFDGVNDTVNCGSNASLDIDGDMSVLGWANLPTPAGTVVMFSKTNGAALGWYLWITAGGIFRAYFYASATTLICTNVILNKWSHVAMSVSDGVCRMFVDGLQEARGAVTASDSGGDSLYVGSLRGAANWMPGLIELPQEWNGALSPEQVYRNYLLAKDVPIYYDTFESYAVTPVAKAVGSKCGPYRVDSGSFNIVADAAGKKWIQYNANGTASMQQESAYGTFEFDMNVVYGANVMQVMLIASVPGSYTATGQNGYMLWISTLGAVYISQINAGGIFASPYTSANGAVASGTEYRFRVVRRVGGQWAVYVKGGAYPDFCALSGATPVTSNTHTTSAYSSISLYIASQRVSNIRTSLVCERPSSFPWEFSTGSYTGIISGSTPWMRAGGGAGNVTYLPKDLDWQTLTFGLYRGSGSSVTDVCFVASEIGGTTFANQNGYCLRLAADESVQLIRMDAGVETLIATTAAAYVANTTEYQIKITHNGTTNAYDFFIMGGAYADWTSMGLGATLGIHTSSNYVTWDLDQGDRTSAPQFFRDLR